MNHLSKSIASRSAVAAVLSLTLASSALAVSATASSAANTASSATSSTSDSLNASSASSSKGTGVAAGDYRIIEVTKVAERPDRTRLLLQPVAASTAGNARAPLELFVPDKALEAAGLSAGQLVTASARPYGTEFADQRTRKAFLLVLHDEALQDLQTRPLSL